MANKDTTEQQLKEIAADDSNARKAAVAAQMLKNMATNQAAKKK